MGRAWKEERDDSSCCPPSVVHDDTSQDRLAKDKALHKREERLLMSALYEVGR